MEDKEIKIKSLLKEFSDWASDKRLTPGSADSYKSYLNTFGDKYKKVMESDKNSSDDKNYLKKKYDELPCDIDDVLYILKLFCDDGDRLYTLALSHMIKNFVIEVNKLNKEENISHLDDCPSAFALLEDFFLEYKYVEGSLRQEEKDILNTVRKKIKKNCLYQQLDGMADLLAELGEQKFFELAINGSYFFCSDLVLKEQKMVKELTDSDFIFDKARNTTDTDIKKEKTQEIARYNKKNQPIYKYLYCFEREKKEYKVEIDPNNNYYVCQLINNLTNLNLGSGKNAIIQNTIISHVWGRAYDPRYFRSLWNIVLIPAWANSLMDKESAAEHTLASKMRATCMAICSNLYKDAFENEKFWESFDLSESPCIANKKDIVKGEYTINIIKGKQNSDDESVIITKQKVKLF